MGHHQSKPPQQRQSLESSIHPSNLTKQNANAIEINLPKLNKHSNQTTSKKNKNPSIPQKKKLSQKLNKSTSKLNDNDHDEVGKQHLPSLTMKFIGKSN